jgi:predicted N-acetyltransferase YhbS
MADFILRPMEPADGPAIDALMRSEALSTAVSLSTRYAHDVYTSLLALQPSLFGVVATLRGGDDLVGVATAFIEDVRVGSQTLPGARLENLKVRHDVRRQGLGGRLARWRIDEARRRFGGEGVIATAIDATNEGSLATARKWSTDILGPMRIVIAKVATKPPRADGPRVRTIGDGDIEAVVDRVNAFYEGVTLYPPQTADSIWFQLGPTSVGEPVRQYRVAVDRDGAIVAGTFVTERFKLMTDVLERVPTPLALVARVVPLIPPDRVIRSVELSLAWHAPGRLDAARALWDAIRYEWRASATNVGATVDPAGTLAEAFASGRFMMPKVELMVPILSPVPFDRTRPVCVWR